MVTFYFWASHAKRQFLWPIRLSRKKESITLSLLSKVLLSVVVQSLSRIQLFATPWTAARQPSLSFSISRNLLKFISIESVILSNHLILRRPLVLPSVFPNIGVFSSELALWIKWPKYWSFSISLCNEYSGLTSFRIDWFDLLAVQGTLKSLLQHHNLKASILQHTDFFKVPQTHPFVDLIFPSFISNSFLHIPSPVKMGNVWPQVWYSIGSIQGPLLSALKPVHSSSVVPPLPGRGSLNWIPLPATFMSLTGKL